MKDLNGNVVSETYFQVNLTEAPLKIASDVIRPENTVDFGMTDFSDRDVNGISVYVSGKKVEFDVQPQLINSRTMVPLRAIFEALGADVEWDSATQTAIGEMVGDVVEITIGKNFLQKNHEKKSLDSPAVIISGRTLVPVRAIAECFDCEVKWYADLKVVEIIKK